MPIPPLRRITTAAWQRCALLPVFRPWGARPKFALSRASAGYRLSRWLSRFRRDVEFATPRCRLSRICGSWRRTLQIVLRLYRHRLLPCHFVSITTMAFLVSPRGAFGLYISHFEKACQILNISMSWYGPLLLGVIMGLARAHDKSNDFDNVASPTSLRKLIEFDGIDSQFSTI